MNMCWCKSSDNIAFYHHVTNVYTYTYVNVFIYLNTIDVNLLNSDQNFQISERNTIIYLTVKLTNYGLYGHLMPSFCGFD